MLAALRHGFSASVSALLKAEFGQVIDHISSNAWHNSLFDGVLLYRMKYSEIDNLVDYLTH